MGDHRVTSKMNLRKEKVHNFQFGNICFYLVLKHKVPDFFDIGHNPVTGLHAKDLLSFYLDYGAGFYKPKFHNAYLSIGITVNVKVSAII